MLVVGRGTNERVEELNRAQPSMNCELCEYRTQAVGSDTDAGAPQTGHHHHLRGVGPADGPAHHTATAVITVAITPIVITGGDV